MSDEKRPYDLSRELVVLQARLRAIENYLRTHVGTPEELEEGARYGHLDWSSDDNYEIFSTLYDILRVTHKGREE